MKNESYQGQPVLSRGEARLVPPNAGYPNTICTLILTDSNLYISERRFNGTYEDFIIIPVRQLHGMEIIRQRSGSVIKSLILGLVALVGGWLWISVPQNRDCLEVDYYDDSGTWTCISFVELDSSIKGVVKSYQQFRNQQPGEDNN